MGHRLGVQTEDATRGGGGSEDSARSGDVPAHVVVGRVDGDADAAADFDSHRDGEEEIPPARPRKLGGGKGGGNRRRAGMDDGGEVRIVVIV